MPLSAVATIREGVEPRTLNRFQQLNAVKISGVAPRSLDAGLKVLEDAAAKILPPGYRIDYTGESRQLRQEGGKFLPAMGLALVLIFLVLAAQFNSFRDPFVILAGSVPLAMFGALIFTFLKFARPAGDALQADRGVDDDAQHLLAGRARHARRARVEERHPDRRVRQRAAGAGDDARSRRCARRPPTRLRPILMTTVATVVGHFPLTLVTGAGAVARNSIGIVLVGGMTIGTFFTLFVVPSVYVLIAKDHRGEHAHEAELERDDPPAPRESIETIGLGGGVAARTVET